MPNQFTTLTHEEKKALTYCITTWGARLKVNSKRGKTICVSDPDARDAGQYIHIDEIVLMIKVKSLKY